MPTAKAKGGSRSHCYRPASEYDDAILAQKREYWRTKKREQRARLSERRGKQTQCFGGKQIHSNGPMVVNYGVSGSVATVSSQNKDELYKTNISSASKSGNTIQDSLAKDAESQKGQIETVKLNKVMPLLPLSSCSHSTNVGGCTRATEKCPTEGVVGKTITSPKTSRLQLNTSLSVPTVRLTRIINSSSGKRASQLCASMQGTSAPRTQHMSQVALCVQPKLLSTNMKTDMISPGATVSIKIEDKVASTTPQSGTKSAMVDTSQRAKGVNKSQSSPETEEEKAAKRREQWRIKKREQRAKVAARLAKAREKTCGMEMTLQRPLAQKAGHIIGKLLQQHPLQPLVRGAAQKRCPPRVKISFASTKKENDKVQIDKVVTVNPQREPIKGKNPNISRGIVRCKTTRQRFIEPHKLLMNQRNTRCKTLLLNSVLGPRNIANSSDTPEQITAKRREYWRIKKREQRAKLSFEVKVRLKEKDSLMRRMKRYQNIPEEKWRARALTQSGNSLTHVSETIGGFIKEDGTVTNDVHQVPTYHDTAPHSSEEECLLVSENSSITKSQCQPGSKRSNQPPALLHLTQVKIFPPLSGRSCSKPRQLLSIRPHSSAGKSVNQLTFSHPQATPNRMPTPRINVGGAVRKMAVLNSASRAPSLDPELTEEERMARKREYWRIKKREQRAAYAARMKSGLLQTKTSAALEEKAPKQVAVTTVAQGRMFTNPTKNLFDDSVPFTPNESEIKQERESMPASDLNSQPEQAVCPDIKPSTSPPHPAPHPEPDLALNADSQATTLLAVASMKKLLEESLSTVTECKSEQSDIKIQSVEETSEPEIKPNVTAISFEENDMSAFGADLTVETKSWQPESDILEHGPPSPHLMSTCQNSVTLPTFPSSRNENYSSEQSFQSSSNVTVNCMEPFVGPPSANRPQRLCTIKARHQNCCPSEPPKLHHLPIDEHSKHHQAPEQGQNKPPSVQRHSSVGKKQSGLTSLQKKREYWKLMKRKQRARIKATHSERQSECSTRLFRRNIQPPDLVVSTGKGINLLAKPAIQPKPTIAAQTAVATIVVVNPTTCNAEKLADTLQVKLPVTNVSCSNERNQANVGPECRGIPGNPQGLMPVTQTRMSTSTDVDSAQFLLTLKPPVNAPTISQQPIDPPGQTLSPGVPSSQFQTTTYMVEASTKLAPTSTMGPPKPIPGECEQDFLRRKREYWRIKKKEQRAKKAIQEKGITAKRGSTNWEPILPAQDLPTHVRAEQYSGQWVGVSSSEESEQLISASLDTELGSEPYSNYTAPIEDESELLFVDSENNDGEERHMSNTMWRNCYLMDYDPLNQLLVCMVCGELQYSHSLEGVRTHIDETHPDTLIMDPGEKQRILEAWDEQVSLRERFFSNQLQQHSGALAVCHRM